MNRPKFNLKLFSFAVLTLCLSLQGAMAQQHHMSQQYEAPKEAEVLQKLAKWQDLKFGLFMHWGPYSQWGVVESWSICPEDEGWTQRKGPHAETYEGYKKAYEELQTTFNPVKFNPEQWVAAAKDAGMKYMVFTTKHHDGFSMFDTKQTDYKITDQKTPFSTNPKANITKEIFNAFQKEDFMIGAYFSKPDWHSKDYWWPYFPPKDRNVNYDPAKYPERWNKFKDFTYNQIEELMTGYGKVDILWLDGGWVRPRHTIDTAIDWQKGIKHNQDIDMDKIAAMGRKHQPGLIVVDRTVTGPYENYTTPEQEVPEHPLTNPWETCMTMGNSWSYVPDDQYKSAHDIIQLLVKIVSRGGNLLMNIGPGPDGDWDPEVYKRLASVGDWMDVNGEGIYNSVAVSPYSMNNVYFTKSKDKPVIYAFFCAEKEDLTLPTTLDIPLERIKSVKKVSLLGSKQKLKWKKVSLLGSKQKLKWKKEGDGIRITIPAALKNKQLKTAACFKIEH